MSEKDLLTRVHPFSNGTEFMNFLFNNCYQCKWGSVQNENVAVCVIEFSFARAYDGDGKVRPWYVYAAGIGKGGICKVKEQVEEGKEVTMEERIRLDEVTVTRITAAEAERILRGE